MSGIEFRHLALLTREADAREQVRDLVCIHAGSRHFNWTGPVKVVVTQGEYQLLQLEFRKASIVHRDVEMRWLLASLSSTHWEQIKVKLFTRTFT